jgi:ribonuclease P/MRP protein subunit POP5
MVRVKHRYLLINILYPTDPPPGVKLPPAGVPDFIRFHAPSPTDFLSADLARLIRGAIVDLAGDYGAASTSSGLKGAPPSPDRVEEANPAVVYHSPATSTAIVRVPRDQHRLARAALSMVTGLPRPWRTPCVVRVVRVSGTVRKAEEAAVEDATRALRRARAAGEGGEGFVLEAAGVMDQGESGSDGEEEEEDGGEDRNSSSGMDTD